MIKPIFNLSTEIWKPIIHIPYVREYYSISSFGNVYSSASESLLTQFITENGYNVVGLMTDSGSKILRKIHRIELMEFCYFEGCESYEVNHKDGCKQNNRLWNLEWVTSKENIAHDIDNGLRNSFRGENNPRSIFSEDDILYIGCLIMSKQYSDDKIINMTKCTYDTIIGIISGNAWNYLFSDDERKLMRLGRRGYNILESDKELLCKYYENNKIESPKYGDITKLIKSALIHVGIEYNQTNYRIAKRLYYRHQDNSITSKYNY